MGRSFKRRHVVVNRLTTVLFSFLMIACASSKSAEQASPPPAPPTGAVKKFNPAHITNPEETSLMARANFTPGSAVLDGEAKDRLSRALAQAQTLGAVHEIKILTWADGEYPSKTKKKHSEKDVKVAENRGESIREYFRTISGNSRLPFYSFNMAKRPSSTAEFFNTADARVKESMEDAGIPTTQDKRIVPSRASSALIIFGIVDSDKYVNLKYETI